MPQWPLVTVGDDLDKIVKAKLKKSKESYAEVVRRLMAEWVGKPDLANDVKMGRPPKQDG